MVLKELLMDRNDKRYTGWLCNVRLGDATHIRHPDSLTFFLDYMYEDMLVWLEAVARFLMLIFHITKPAYGGVTTPNNSGTLHVVLYGVKQNSHPMHGQQHLITICSGRCVIRHKSTLYGFSRFEVE